MRHYFEKGQQLKTQFGQFLLSYNKLDSHSYALERIQNCSADYVYKYYSSIKDQHLLRYYTCWEQEQLVAKKVDKQQITEPKASKKKTMLNSFLSKKKTDNQLGLKNQLSSFKSKKDMEVKKQQFAKVRVVYVQLEGFQNFQFPVLAEQIKKIMSIIYLLARNIYKKHQVWPNMIPVVTNQGSLRFVKKGTNRQQELVRLFNHGFKNMNIGQWSAEIAPIYEMHRINGDFGILGLKIHEDLIDISSKQYQITIICEGKKKEEKALFPEPDVLYLVNSNMKLELDQFTISFSYSDQKTKQVYLESYTQQPITLIGQSSNFIIRYLKSFKTK